MSHIPSLWPVKGFITSGFGRRTDPIEDGTDFHTGVDISTPYGSPVQAPAEGLVIFCGWQQGYGNCVEISHGGGVVTRYAHLSKILVKPGAELEAVAEDRFGGNLGTHDRSSPPLRGAPQRPAFRSPALSHLLGFSASIHGPHSAKTRASRAHGDLPMSILDRSLAAIFGTKHERDIKAIQPLVYAVNAWEPKLAALSDLELRAKTPRP